MIQTFLHVTREIFFISWLKVWWLRGNYVRQFNVNPYLGLISELFHEIAITAAAAATTTTTTTN
jgi:hypothetical protein